LLPDIDRRFLPEFRNIMEVDRRHAPVIHSLPLTVGQLPIDLPPDSMELWLIDHMPSQLVGNFLFVLQ
jgi:hypothetical protein